MSFRFPIELAAACLLLLVGCNHRPQPESSKLGADLACTMHEGTDFHGHARKFGDVGA